MSHIDPDAIKFFWWMVSWGGSLILGTATLLVEGGIAVILAGLLGLKIARFMKELF